MPKGCDWKWERDDRVIGKQFESTVDGSLVTGQDRDMPSSIENETPSMIVYGERRAPNAHRKPIHHRKQK